MNKKIILLLTITMLLFILASCGPRWGRVNPCEDGVMDRDEEGVDCGGSYCDPCYDASTADSDGDTIVDANDICDGIDDRTDVDGDGISDCVDESVLYADCGGPYTVIENDDVDLDASASIGEIAWYKWEESSGAWMKTPYSQYYLYANEVAGDYTLTLTVTDSNGNEATCETTLTLIPEPTSTQDSDGDGAIDEIEDIYGTNPYDDDSDNDGLLDGDEVNIYESDPSDDDSDLDFYNDYTEVNFGTDPNDLSSFPTCSTDSDCASGSICYSNKCSFYNYNKIDSCSEDDAGIDYYNKGSVTYVEEDDEGAARDLCFDDNLLVEYFCGSGVYENYVLAHLVSCTCVDDSGACS